MSVHVHERPEPISQGIVIPQLPVHKKRMLQLQLPQLALVAIALALVLRLRRLPLPLNIRVAQCTKTDTPAFENHNLDSRLAISVDSLPLTLRTSIASAGESRLVVRRHPDVACTVTEGLEEVCT